VIGYDNGTDSSEARWHFGRQPRAHPACCAGWRSFAPQGANIQMISTSEIKVSVGIEDKGLELAVRALHKVFGLDAPAA